LFSSAWSPNTCPRRSRLTVVFCLCVSSTHPNRWKRQLTKVCTEGVIATTIQTPLSFLDHIHNPEQARSCCWFVRCPGCCCLLLAQADLNCPPGSAWRVSVHLHLTQ
jgi:hypothetical protein